MSAPKRESYFKRKLAAMIKEQLHNFLVISHVDVQSGIPDWSITGNGVTSWLEFKHGTPAFTSHGVQVVVARKLAIAGKCRYVVFWERGDAKETLIVDPKDVVIGRNATVVAEEGALGHNLQFVISYIKKVHGVAA